LGSPGHGRGASVGRPRSFILQLDDLLPVHSSDEQRIPADSNEHLKISTHSPLVHASFVTSLISRTLCRR
jgi:hypothetical protein